MSIGLIAMLATLSTAAASPSTLISGRDVGVPYSSYVAHFQHILDGIDAASARYKTAVKIGIPDAAINAYLVDIVNGAKAIDTPVLQTEAHPYTLSDIDAAYFEAVQSAASTLAWDERSLSVDFESMLQGFDAGDTPNKDAEIVKVDRLAYLNAVIAGYKHFGFRQTEVDPINLTLKRER